jgi:hypothetical protein
MDLFQHVRSVISILVGFSLTRLLSTAPQLAQRERKRVYWVHVVWCLFMFLYTIGFCWWAFQLITVPRWTFPLYVFVAVYGAVVYFLCALLSPNDLSTTKDIRNTFSPAGNGSSGQYHPNLGVTQAQAVACTRACRLCVESIAVEVCGGVRIEP